MIEFPKSLDIISFKENQKERKERKFRKSKIKNNTCIPFMENDPVRRKDTVAVSSVANTVLPTKQLQSEVCQEMVSQLQVLVKTV